MLPNLASLKLHSKDTSPCACTGVTLVFYRGENEGEAEFFRPADDVRLPKPSEDGEYVDPYALEAWRDGSKIFVSSACGHGILRRLAQKWPRGQFDRQYCGLPIQWVENKWRYTCPVCRIPVLEHDWRELGLPTLPQNDDGHAFRNRVSFAFWKANNYDDVNYSLEQANRQWNERQRAYLATPRNSPDDAPYMCAPWQTGLGPGGFVMETAFKRYFYYLSRGSEPCMYKVVHRLEQYSKTPRLTVHYKGTAGNEVKYKVTYPPHPLTGFEASERWRGERGYEYKIYKQVSRTQNEHYARNPDDEASWSSSDALSRSKLVRRSTVSAQDSDTIEEDVHFDFEGNVTEFIDDTMHVVFRDPEPSAEYSRDIEFGTGDDAVTFTMRANMTHVVVLKRLNGAIPMWSYEDPIRSSKRTSVDKTTLPEQLGALKELQYHLEGNLVKQLFLRGVMATIQFDENQVWVYNYAQMYPLSNATAFLAWFRTPDSEEEGGYKVVYLQARGADYARAYLLRTQGTSGGLRKRRLKNGKVATDYIDGNKRVWFRVVGDVVTYYNENGFVYARDTPVADAPIFRMTTFYQPESMSKVFEEVWFTPTEAELWDPSVRKVVRRVFYTGPARAEKPVWDRELSFANHWGEFIEYITASIVYDPNRPPSRLLQSSQRNINTFRAEPSGEQGRPSSNVYDPSTVQDDGDGAVIEDKVPRTEAQAVKPWLPVELCDSA